MPLIWDWDRGGSYIIGCSRDIGLVGGVQRLSACEAGGLYTY